jgi:hypothetical protein
MCVDFAQCVRYNRGMTAHQTILQTTDEVIDALGGNAGFARIAGTTPNAVRNFRTKLRGYFPNDIEMYLRVSKELKRLRLSMSLSLWGNPSSQRRSA